LLNGRLLKTFSKKFWRRKGADETVEPPAKNISDRWGCAVIRVAIAPAVVKNKL
jgi:hypothetical protein